MVAVSGAKKEMTPAQKARAERAARARREGQRKAAAAAKTKTPDAVIPDTTGRQAAAALAKLKKIETDRGNALFDEPKRTVPSPQAKPKISTPVKAAATVKKPATAKAPTGTPMSGVHEVDVEKAVQKMNIEHVQCRDFGHSWRPFSARWMPDENCYESQLRCSRCSTVRTRWLGRHGEQLGGTYNYAEGYTIKGLGRLSGADRDHVRLASLMSVLVEDTAAEA